MPTVKITGVPPYDGTWDLATPFTTRDWRTVKRVSGVRPMEFVEALRTADVDLTVALALNALRQAGKGDLPVEVFDAAESGAIALDFSDDSEEAEVEERPPGSLTPDGGESKASGQPSGGERPLSSGSGLRSVGDQQEASLRATGSLG